MHVSKRCRRVVPAAPCRIFEVLLLQARGPRTSCSAQILSPTPTRFSNPSHAALSSMWPCC